MVEGEALVGELAGRWHADGGDRAGVDDAADPGGEGGEEDVLRALDVDRVHEGVVGQPERVDGRQVVDDVAAGDGARDRGRVGDVEADHLDVEAGQVGVGLARGEGRSDLPALRQELADDRRPDEATRSGHERFHAVVSITARVCATSPHPPTCAIIDFM